MMNDEPDESRYIQVRKIGSRYWGWSVFVPGNGSEHSEEPLRSEAGAWDEARQALRRILASAG